MCQLFIVLRLKRYSKVSCSFIIFFCFLFFIGTLYGDLVWLTVKMFTFYHHWYFNIYFLFVAVSGFVGLFTGLLLWPGFFILHYSKIETFQWPDGEQILFILLNGLVGTVLSEFLWLWFVFLYWWVKVLCILAL